MSLLGWVDLKHFNGGKGNEEMKENERGNERSVKEKERKGSGSMVLYLGRGFQNLQFSPWPIMAWDLRFFNASY